MTVYICTNCEEPLLPSEFKDGKCPVCGCNKIIPEDDYFSLDTPTNNTSTNPTQNVPKCPTCGSTNVEKISTAKKALGFAMVGLFSSNLGKTMHCKNCGYKW